MTKDKQNQPEIKLDSDLLGNAMNQFSLNTPETQELRNSIAKTILDQSALKDNILAYKVANSYYLDGLSLAKTMGVLDIAKDHITPFPTRPSNTVVITSPPPLVVPPPLPVPTPASKPAKPWKKIALALGLAIPTLGAGIAIPLIYDRLTEKPPTVEGPMEIPHVVNPNVEVEVY